GAGEQGGGGEIRHGVRPDEEQELLRWSQARTARTQPDLSLFGSRKRLHDLHDRWRVASRVVAKVDEQSLGREWKAEHDHVRLADRLLDGFRVEGGAVVTEHTGVSHRTSLSLPRIVAVRARRGN